MRAVWALINKVSQLWHKFCFAANVDFPRAVNCLAASTLGKTFHKMLGVCLFEKMCEPIPQFILHKMYPNVFSPNVPPKSKVQNSSTWLSDSGARKGSRRHVSRVLVLILEYNGPTFIFQVKSKEYKGMFFFFWCPFRKMVSYFLFFFLNQLPCINLIVRACVCVCVCTVLLFSWVILYTCMYACDPVRVATVKSGHHWHATAK